MQKTISAILPALLFLLASGVYAKPDGVPNGLPSGIAGDVTVQNSDLNPVPVVVLPEKIPYRDLVQTEILDDLVQCRFDVPTGKRLVIEVLSASFAALEISTSWLDTKLHGEAGPYHRDYPIGFVKVPTGAYRLIIKADGPFYADDTNWDSDGADIVWTLIAEDGGNFSIAVCSISGYLIPAPST